ncbi:MAG: acyltransferase [Bacteroidetes bacterium HGW-Bacteroidetes-6]|nr:MAG: acyltransferase [Bacteroidetes bacterium HGW-Bacteroidetes-6]
MSLTPARQKWRFIRWPRIVISQAILRLCGWRYRYLIPTSITKSVMLVAPHTSNWDFILGRLCYNALDIRVRFMIKKEMFFFPLGIFLRIWGGIPVDRKKPGNITEQALQLFARFDELTFGITPEGTRKPNPRWKKGFYRIAMHAGVPIVLTYLDYGKKDAVVGKAFYPTGDYSKDMKEIAAFFSTVTPAHPEGYVTPEF